MNDATKPQTPGAEPSMEEILASIRRIISEDGTPAPAPAAAPAPARPTPAPQPAAAAQPVAAAQPAPQPTPQPAPQPAPVAAPARPAPAEEPVLDLTQMVSPPTSDFAADLADDEPGIASGGTIAASAAALSGLQQPAPARPVQNLRLGDGSVTLEDLVRSELRPLLRQWLDANLPGVVERLVQREIQRITRSVDPS